MKIFAVVENDVVENIVNAEEQIILELILPEKTIIEETEATGLAWVGAEVIDGKFKAPQPYASWTWDSNLFTWIAPKDKPSTQADGVWEWDETNLVWVDKVYPTNVPEPK